MTIDRRALVAEAMLAPSVHNVQPARWRLVGEDRLDLFEDVRTRLTVGDPHGNDAGISLGAAAEGLRLAAGRHGLALVAQEPPVRDDPVLRPIVRYRLVPSDAPSDPLATQVERRASWRGAFLPATPADRAAAQSLGTVLIDPATLTQAGRLFDRASYEFMRDPPFRAELRSWMRFTPRHPRWHRDGLNAEAMALGRVEALGASVVLGSAFGLLHTLRLAPALLAEGGKVAKAAGLVVFHRPVDEPPFDSGAAFYRLWLEIEAAGFGAAVLAALADDPTAAAQIATLADVPAGQRIVSAFRIGRRPAGATVARARRPLDEVLV